MTPSGSRVGRARRHRSPAPLSLVVAFAGLGGTASVVPAVLPAAAHSSTAGTGYLLAVPVTFVGLLFGVVLSIRLLRRGSALTVVAIGALVQCAALGALVVLPPPPAFVIFAGCAGLGFGLVEAAGSALARLMVGASVTHLLTTLTAVVALAAATCPLAVTFIPLAGAPSIALALVAAVHLAAVALLVVPAGRVDSRPMRSRPPSGPPRSDEQAPSARRPAMDSDAAFRLDLARTAGALLLYVGVEATLSGWSAVIVTTLLTPDARQAALGTSAFWLLMGAGRLITALALRSRHAQPRRQLSVAAIAGAGLLLLAGTVTGAPRVEAVVLCGAVLFLGPFYSLILGTGLSRTPRARVTQVTGPLVACGAAGGALLPALTLAAGSDPTDRFTLVVAAVLVLVAGLLLAVRPSRTP